MDLFNTFLIAIALAMDSFSVSISAGASQKKVKFTGALLVATYFGFFQFIMTILGWRGGTMFSNVISTYDHWIAFGLLFLIGGKMVLESFDQTEEKALKLSHKLLFVLAIATSIDAMGIGLSYAFLNKPILISSIIIGIVAFIFSATGVYLGKLLKNVLKNSADLVGGVILIGIGISIMIEHGAFNFLFR